MSFFSKLNSKFEGLMKDDNGSQQQQQQQNAQRGYEQQNSYPPPNQYQQPQQQYQSPPPVQAQQWGAPPPQSQYNSPPPQQYGAYPPPAPTGPSLPPTPSVPQGWMPLFDPSGMRWAYLDLPNNSISWSVPTAPAYPSQAGGGGYDASRGVGMVGPGGAGGYGSGGYGGNEPAKDNSKKNMMMGAAGGLAVGAIGGMVLANAFDGDENRGGAPPMGAPLPEMDKDGSSVSSSDREEVEEARREYEEAYEDTYGSD